MSNLTLTHDELVRITGKQRYKAQAKQLARMGIEHRLSATGEPIVSRAHFERVMGGGLESANDHQAVELNLDFTGT